jgi:hypothetical protein
MLKELLRWFVIAPMGVPHRLMEDDYYKGMNYVPAGCLVFCGFVTDFFLRKGT